MKNTNTWYTNELIAAPYIPMFGLLINIIFNINLIIAPSPAAMAGTFDWLTPYSPPVSVWDSDVNIIDTDAIINIPAPSEAVDEGNSNGDSCNSGNAGDNVPEQPHAAEE